ncbi:hypothetical protein [Kribbella sp. NPDC004875]|uniref:hypothetical protein n=1 Tax=Kribbella sp. NPDC004875 TaxID=3364107 RepID=UPI0036C5E946
MKVLAATLLVAVIAIGLTLVCLTALQAQVPRNMPFGVTGSSPVVTAAQSAKVGGYSTSWDNKTYPNESAVMDAINQGDIYGAYITGTSSDTLILVPAKSFFATTEIGPVFAAAASKAGRPLAVEQVKPLPADKDPVGAVGGLLLLPILVGGLVSAILATKSTGKAVQQWRLAILAGYALIGTLLTLLIAGPWFGAFAGNRFWPLFPCLFLIEVTTAFVTAVLLAVLPAVVAMVVALAFFIVVGLPTSGSAGTALMPAYWQTIGGWLPPRHGADLIQNVLYFSSNNITTPIVILLAYMVVAGVVLGFLDIRARRTSAAAARTAVQGNGQTGGSAARRVAAVLAIPLLLGGLQQCLFASNYTSASHRPLAHNLPFAVAGQSPLLSEVQKNISLDVTTHASESDAKTAIGKADAWGALVTADGQSTLIVVPSISDLAGLDLITQFERVARSSGAQLAVSSYTPTPLASGDPFAIVLSMLLTPLLIAGYMSSTMLRTATGVPTGRYRGLVLLAFSVVFSGLVALVAGPWRNGFPTDKFWAVWGIMALVVAVVAMFAAVLQRLLGAVGTFITVFIVILFGKPSSGGANGVPYLPGFWRAIGPYLPPENAYLLLRNTVYFGGNGITRPLVVLGAYLVVFGALLGVLDWWRKPGLEVKDVSKTAEAASASAATPAGVAI